MRPASKPSASSTDAKTSDKADSKSGGDAANPTSIHLGRYVYIDKGVVLHPPSRLSTSSSTSSSSTNSTTTTPSLTYYPLRISDHVYLGPSTGTSSRPPIQDNQGSLKHLKALRPSWLQLHPSLCFPDANFRALPSSLSCLFPCAPISPPPLLLPHLIFTNPISQCPAPPRSAQTCTSAQTAR